MIMTGVGTRDCCCYCRNRREYSAMAKMMDSLKHLTDLVASASKFLPILVAGSKKISCALFHFCRLTGPRRVTLGCAPFCSTRSKATWMIDSSDQPS